jgi:hypothetical protein
VLQNNLLYIRSFTNADDSLKFHFISHTALDMVEEKGKYARHFTLSSSELPLRSKCQEIEQCSHCVGHVLGLALSNGRVQSVCSNDLWPLLMLLLRSYGYITNTKIKFITVVDDSSTEVKEADLRNVHAQLQEPTLADLLQPSSSVSCIPCLWTWS